MDDYNKAGAEIKNQDKQPEQPKEDSKPVPDSNPVPQPKEEAKVEVQKEEKKRGRKKK